MSPFGGIKDSGNGVKEGVLEAMKFFTHVKHGLFLSLSDYSKASGFNVAKFELLSLGLILLLLNRKPSIHIGQMRTNEALNLFGSIHRHSGH